MGMKYYIRQYTDLPVSLPNVFQPFLALWHGSGRLGGSHRQFTRAAVNWPIVNISQLQILCCIPNSASR